MKKLKLLLPALLLGFLANSQIQQIKIVSFTVKNQLPAVIDNWSNTPGSLLLVAQLPPTVRVKGIRLMVQIKAGGAIICSNNSAGGLQVDELTTRTFSANELTGTLAGCHELKDGSYTICVQFFNVDQMAISSEACKEFTVETPKEAEYAPPTLINPENGKTFLKKDMLKPVMFRWTTLVPKPKEPVTYRLKVWQLMQGQSGTEAMRSNEPIVTKDVANFTQTAISNLYTGPCKPPHLCDYVWSVQVKNSEGFGEKNVTSEPSSFKIISNEEINPKTIDHQVWENFGQQVRCERLGVTFQAAKKIGVNLYRLFAEFSDIVYYQTKEFVNNHPLPEPNIISYERLFPVVSDRRLFCDEDGRTISRLNGIWKVTEHNTRTGGYIELGSIPPVNFSLFTLVNLWNNNHPDNLDNSCSCRLGPGWTSGWEGGSPWIDSLISAEENRPPEEDSTGTKSWHPDIIIYDSGKIIAISGKDKLNNVRVYFNEARLLELAGAELVNLKISNEEFLKKLNSYLLAGDINQLNTYRRGIIKRDNGVSRDCYTVFCDNPNHPPRCGWQECSR